MKSFALLLLCASLAIAKNVDLTEYQKGKIAEYYEGCTASTGVDKELVAQGRKGNFADDQKLKEYYHCMFKKVGFQNEAGEVQTDVIRAKMPKDLDKDEAEIVIAACKDKGDDSPTETAYLVYKCYWETSPTHITLA